MRALIALVAILVALIGGSAGVAVADTDLDDIDHIVISSADARWGRPSATTSTTW